MISSARQMLEFFARVPISVGLRESARRYPCVGSLMIVVFAIVLVVHGLIHLLGFAKAFGFADLPQLRQPVSPFMGVLWLIAALLFLAAAGSLFVWPRWWWAIGACAIGVSMVMIVPDV